MREALHATLAQAVSGHYSTSSKTRFGYVSYTVFHLLGLFSTAPLCAYW